MDFNNLSSGLIGTILGSVIALLGTYTSNRNQTKILERQLNQQENLFRKKISYDKKIEGQITKLNIKFIIIDIVNAIIQGITFVKNRNNRQPSTPTLLFYNKDSVDSLRSLIGILTDEDIMLIYKIYGILDKINYDILSLNTSKDTYDGVEISFNVFLKEILSGNFNELISGGQADISKERIYSNLSEEYKAIFKKLNTFSN